MASEAALQKSSKKTVAKAFCKTAIGFLLHNVWLLLLPASIQALVLYKLEVSAPLLHS